MAEAVTDFRILHDQLGRPGRAQLVVKCSLGYAGECRFALWDRPAAGAMWQWNGDIEKPTITPSINCGGGCGRHFTMIAGKPV